MKYSFLDIDSDDLMMNKGVFLEKTRSISFENDFFIEIKMKIE